MPGAGINGETGKPLDGWAHVVQSLFVLFTTSIGMRVMRRYYYSDVPNLLGENITSRTVLRFAYAVAVACELWEPRFRLTKIDIDPAANSPDQVRTGRLRFAMRGKYMPRGHLGDFTPARGEYLVSVGLGSGGIEVVQ